MPKEKGSKKKMDDDSEDEWPSSSDSSSGRLTIFCGEGIQSVFENGASGQRSSFIKGKEI